MEGVNSTMIYCKNFCKCYNLSLVQHYDNFNTLVFHKQYSWHLLCALSHLVIENSRE
jgi:hypothetical protein